MTDKASPGALWAATAALVEIRIALHHGKHPQPYKQRVDIAVSYEQLAKIIAKVEAKS